MLKKKVEILGRGLKGNWKNDRHLETAGMRKVRESERKRLRLSRSNKNLNE